MDERDELDPAARRTVQRLDVNLPGRAIIQGRAPLSCIVRNMSENGALIEFSAAIRLPARFHLEIPDLDTEAYCEICHQRSNRVGVEFVRVTVNEGGESAEDAEVRRRADHWDAADVAMTTGQSAAIEADDFDTPPQDMRHSAPAASTSKKTGPGSSIRAAVSVGRGAMAAAPGTSGRKSWRERLLGR
jgi:hypothetical protein